MQIRALHLIARVGLAGVVWAGLSGCLLQESLGYARVVSSVGDEGDDILAALFARVLGSNCRTITSPPNNQLVNCTYLIDGEEISSTVDLVSELGLLGALIDPLILEVPSDVTNVTATYDSGGGPQPLPVDRADSFQVHPGLRITAEVGTTFLFLDLPGDVIAGLPNDPDQGIDLDFSLSYHRLVPHGLHPPVTIKPMTAGLVIAQHQRYYIPLLPCVTDFADVPAVTIPESDTPQHLEMTLGDLIRSHAAEPCNHVVHDFSAAVPPPGLVFAPLVRR